ncbi:hypothetical protein [Halobacterium sp. CBA1126]|uniref:hypothetical protein n=1 Tax=Halobacterium sp. CBA1126 TaxID=2668074 RepID=UPI001E43416E|nr:hypothetical protein [Halobacterium sp. CBA1126]
MNAAPVIHAPYRATDGGSEDVTRPASTLACTGVTRRNAGYATKTSLMGARRARSQLFRATHAGRRPTTRSRRPPVTESVSRSPASTLSVYQRRSESRTLASTPPAARTTEPRRTPAAFAALAEGTTASTARSAYHETGEASATRRIGAIASSNRPETMSPKYARKAVAPMTVLKRATSADRLAR